MSLMKYYLLLLDIQINIIINIAIIVAYSSAS